MKEEYCHLDQVSIFYITLFYYITGPPTATWLYAAPRHEGRVLSSGSGQHLLYRTILLYNWTSDSRLTVRCSMVQWWKHCKYKVWVSFFLGSLGMNWSMEQILAREPLCSSRDLFVQGSDSYPMNPEKRHLFCKHLVLGLRVKRLQNFVNVYTECNKRNATV